MSLLWNLQTNYATVAFGSEKESPSSLKIIRRKSKTDAGYYLQKIDRVTSVSQVGCIFENVD